ncbi:MAG: glycoside hydrolase TIM-barrel-like domain-containing protein [Pseudomonadota bacterium]
MATLVLSAAGAALGGTIQGSFLGLTGPVIGRAIGATVGRVIDQRLLAQGSEPVETGKIDRYRLSGVGEGTPIAKLHGRMRLPGQVIWSTHFKERTSTSGGGGGKGSPPQPKTTNYSYSVSLALALCEGEIASVGRIWADGTLIERDTLNLTIYRGSEDQLPDPKIEAVEGTGNVPAYRGIAYVVIEDLELSEYGNRVPQFNFEVVRAAAPEAELPTSAHEAVQGVALMPGSGEYALATTPVSFKRGVGGSSSVNTNTTLGGTDFAMSLEAMRDHLPNLDAVSLIVSWFGDDLRAGQCRVRPKVEQKLEEGAEMAWSVSGLGRAEAQQITQVDGRPVYGGTPTDQSVIEAIQALGAAGKKVVIYPFLLMELLEGNGLPDPWSENGEQPPFPWRGRITGEKAPGLAGSPDRTAANRAAVDAFFGTVTASDFSVSAGSVSYSGPNEWTYSRFILHLAALTAAAGGAEAFCIGTEMRGLTQMRDEFGFPAVARFKQLAAEVRNLLPDVLLSYAADWSEYFGYQPQDGTGDVFFHLDPLWADENIDFIGIDNYMPLSDWRDGTSHLDAGWESVYNLDYLKANIEGGEGYDWFYPSAEAREAQLRAPITDGAGGSPWVYRYKDIRNWWGNLHFERRQKRDISILANGDQPLAWTALGGAVLAPGSGNFGFYDSPALITGAAASDGTLAAASPALVADQQYEITCHFRLGSSGRYRVRLDHADGIRDVSGTGAGVPAVTGAAPSVQDLRLSTNEDGVLSLRMIIRPNQAGPLTLSFSPDGGGNITLYGVELVAWPDKPTDWVPQSKPIWFTEFGCAAIDKGANQPNIFLDPKSSESGLPHYSNGRRDDTMQAQLLRAITEYWADPETNPISPVYGGPMLDLSRCFAWAWDARPYPAFPNNQELWSDGANYATGHWLNGRASNQPLDLVVAEICERSGLKDYDVSCLRGSVRGAVSADIETARAQLQSLMLAFNFSAVERGGKLVFSHPPLNPTRQIGDDAIAIEDDLQAIKRIRAPQAETIGRVQLSYTEADGAFETRVTEAQFPDDDEITTSRNELALSLTASEARDIAQRWLASARVARDSLELALPPSARDVEAGRVVSLSDGTLWRVDRVEDRGLRRLEAARVEPSLLSPPDTPDQSLAAEPFQLPAGVAPIFMDLPLLTGDEVPHAPHIAVAASPWPGPVAVFSSPSDSDYVLNTTVRGPSRIGLLENALLAAQAGRWDRGPGLRVRLANGALSSVDPENVLNGANVAAIGSGDGDGWEIIQFASAELIEPDLWEISMRLRGQAGSEATMPAAWEAGSYFVLLDGAAPQIDIASSSRGLLRNYLIGPARKSYSDPCYVSRQLAFEGIGLRPYAPAHLRARHDGDDLALSWIRRTRIDGDSWQGVDVPLGETQEAYLLRVVGSGGLIREVELTTPSWIYTQSMQSADAGAQPISVEVAQLSDRFGPGPFTRIDIDA